MANLINTTQTSIASYTTDPIAVSAYSLLFVTCNTTDLAWLGSASLTISRLDTNDEVFPIASLSLAPGTQSMDIGLGTTNNVILGDRIQANITAIDSTTVSTTVCIIGK